MYSSIVKKKCKCGCDKYPSMGYAGYSYSCAPQEIKDKVGNKMQVARKNKNKRMALSRKLHEAQNEVRQKTLNEWFNDIAEKHMTETPYGLGAFCDECNSFIPAQYMRAATAHLLPKGKGRPKFRSVETHELNYMILGAGCGCHYKTDRVDKIVTLKVWPEIARRIKIMMPLLPFEELQFISSQLLVELDKVK